MSESTQDRPHEADEKDPKPGEPDTETEGGFPKEAPESKDGEQQIEAGPSSRIAPRTPRAGVDSR